MSIKKSLIQQAILEVRDIEKFATEKARKALEEEMAPKIKQITNEALKELENSSLNEGMNLEIPAGAELTIKMPEGETSEIENSSETEIENEISDDNSEETINNEENVSIVDDESESEITPEETPAPEAPAPEIQTPVQEEEYELDEEFGEMDEVVYEVEDDCELDEEMVEYELEEEDMSDLNDDSVMEMFNELEIVDEDVEEDNTSVEEIHGVGHNLKHTNTLGKLPKQGVEQRNEINERIKKIKAQYVSKFDGLSQENESLKQTIKEYKDSFIVLRKQINEVQIFNAKLAYANKLFTNGGLTNDEKMKIAEEFDSVETIEEAKKLYNNFLNEMKVSKSAKTPSVAKLKSVNPAVIKASNSKTLFESDEMIRMKRLAGIVKNSEE